MLPWHFVLRAMRTQSPVGRVPRLGPGRLTFKGGGLVSSTEALGGPSGSCLLPVPPPPRPCGGYHSPCSGDSRDRRYTWRRESECISCNSSLPRGCTPEGHREKERPDPPQPDPPSHPPPRPPPPTWRPHPSRTCTEPQSHSSPASTKPFPHSGGSRSCGEGVSCRESGRDPA